ncbi:MAG: putative DNA binding domain-containing protein [Methanoregula sp.]|nr:putative DNA binding domain-containing protein [Methanoregula sp.]
MRRRCTKRAERGGTIFLEITDRGNVVGTLIGTESFKEWANTISQITEPRQIPEIEESSREGKLIVAIRIRENSLKPDSVRGRCYRRVGASNRVMQPYEIAEMHLQSIGSSWDLTPASGTTFADLDTAKILTISGRQTRPEGGTLQLTNPPKRFSRRSVWSVTIYRHGPHFSFLEEIPNDPWSRQQFTAGSSIWMRSVSWTTA